MPGAVVGRKDQRPEAGSGWPQRIQAFRRGPVKAEKLGSRPGFDSQHHQAGTEFEIRHTAIEHGSEKVVRILLGQVVRAVARAGEFPDVMGNAHGFPSKPPVIGSGARRHAPEPARTLLPTPIATPMPPSLPLMKQRVGAGGTLSIGNAGAKPAAGASTWCGEAGASGTV